MLKAEREADILDILSALDVASEHYQTVAATPDVLGYYLGRAQLGITRAVDLALICGLARVVRTGKHNGMPAQFVTITDKGRVFMADNAAEVLRLCADRDPFIRD